MTITDELRAAIEASRVCGDDNTADLLQRALDSIPQPPSYAFPKRGLVDGGASERRGKRPICYEFVPGDFGPVTITLFAPPLSFMHIRELLPAISVRKMTTAPEVRHAIELLTEIAQAMEATE